MENLKAFSLLAFMLSTVGIVTIFITVQSALAAEVEKEQIVINPNDIQNLTAFGQTDRPEYPENFPPSYLFDTLENTYSFWTQQGHSGFDLILKEKLNKPVCSIEIGVFQPLNTPFKVFVNTKSVYNGTLDSEKVKLNYDNGKQCIGNFQTLSMQFDPTDSFTWTTISEIKLFSMVKIPPVEPPTTGNATHITIANSTVTIDLTDSNVSFNGLKIGAFGN